VDISSKEFETKMSQYKSDLDKLFVDSKDLEKEVKRQLAGLKYE
jgi:type I restriction enzyme M protein